MPFKRMNNTRRTWLIRIKEKQHNIGPLGKPPNYALEIVSPIHDGMRCRTGGGRIGETPPDTETH